MKTYILVFCCVCILFMNVVVSVNRVDISINQDTVKARYLEFRGKHGFKITRLNPSLFCGISAPRIIITSAGA